jgi:hypothetical protein
MNLVTVLVVLLIFCVVIWAARALMGAFKIEDPINTVVYVILVLFMLIYLLQFVGTPALRLR